MDFGSMRGRTTLRVAAGWCCAAGLGVAVAAEEGLDDLPDPASPSWDAAAAAALAEVAGASLPLGPEAADRVPCKHWRHLDRSVRSVWGAGLPTIYGFFDGLVWVGDALGLDASAREPTLDRLLRCGLTAEVIGADRLPRSDLARQLRALPDAGSDAWFAVVAGLLGAPLSGADALAVPCDVWAALDSTLVTSRAPGVAATFGFSPARPWRGDLLGLERADREPVLRLLARCGLAHLPPTPDSPEAVAGLLRSLPAPGRSRWDAEVRGLLLASFDADGSGQIDRAQEVRAVPCEVWQTLEDRVRSPWPEGLAARYGIDGGRSWYGYALGLDVGVRRAVEEALGACLRGEDNTAAVVEQLSSLSSGGSRAWDASVRRVLLRAYDADRSDGLDASELAQVPCEVWDVLDARARAAHPKGLIYGYGLRRADPRAERIGLHASAQRAALNRASECLRGDPDAPVADRLRALRDAPGDGAWAIAVRVALLRAGDLDASGWIERRDELEAVPCDAWRVLDEVVREEAGASLMDVYGLRRRRQWGGNELGLGVAVWRPARRVVQRCLDLAP